MIWFWTQSQNSHHGGASWQIAPLCCCVQGTKDCHVGVEIFPVLVGLEGALLLGRPQDSLFGVAESTVELEEWG